jgi:peptidoglycan/LPS O-acetylase OafA/YrhL
MVHVVGHVVLQQTDRPEPGRIRTLDGLRGLAAVAVVLHHCTEASTPALVDVEHGVERPAVWS